MRLQISSLSRWVCEEVAKTCRKILRSSPSATTGSKYVMPPVINYQSIYEQSTATASVIFILSPGADPATDLSKLAEQLGYGGNRLKFLSMGQGMLY